MNETDLAMRLATTGTPSPVASAEVPVETSPQDLGAVSLADLQQQLPCSLPEASPAAIYAPTGPTALVDLHHFGRVRCPRTVRRLACVHWTDGEGGQGDCVDTMAPSC